MSKCRFGRQHNWGKALVAALRSNFTGLELPDDAEWVFWCSTCHAVEPFDA